MDSIKENQIRCATLIPAKNNNSLIYTLNLINNYMCDNEKMTFCDICHSNLKSKYYKYEHHKTKKHLNGYCLKKDFANDCFVNEIDDIINNINYGFY